MAYSVLAQVATFCQDVQLSYHPAYHGKTQLDPHFRVTKDAIDAHVIPKWPTLAEKIQHEVSVATGGIRNTFTGFIPFSGPPLRAREQVVVRDISLVQELRMIKDDDYTFRLYIDGSEVPLKRKVLCDAGPEPENDVSAACSGADPNAAREKLIKKVLRQKSYVERAKISAGSAPEANGRRVPKRPRSPSTL